MTSWWARWRLKSPASRLFTQPFIQTQIKENTKAPRHWPLCGEFTGTGEFPAQRASYAENASIWWRHHEQNAVYIFILIFWVSQMISRVTWERYEPTKKAITHVISVKRTQWVWAQAGQLTHWGRDKMAGISQTIFSNAFSWMKLFELRLKFHWSLFPRVQLTIFHHWFK